MTSFIKLITLAFLGVITFSAHAIFSTDERVNLEDAVQSRRIADIQAHLSRVESTPQITALQQALSNYNLIETNAGLTALGLPPLQPAVETKTYTMQDKSGKSYLLRPLVESDDDQMHALEEAHIQSGAAFVSGEIIPGEYRMNAYLSRYEAHFIPQTFAKFWVLEDADTRALIGSLDYRVDAVLIVHPAYRGRGLAQAAQQHLSTYFTERLGKIDMKMEPIDEEKEVAPLMQQESFESFSALVPEFLSFLLQPYSGFSGDVGFSNIASLKVSCKNPTLSIASFECGHVQFVFPKREESLLLRTLINILLTAHPQDRKTIENAMSALQTPAEEEE